MSKIYLVLTIVAMCGSGLSGCGRADRKSAQVDPVKLRLFSPLPEAVPAGHNPITEEKVSLGRMLYHDPRLSRDQTVSCNSCHQLEKYGVDGSPTSAGFKGLRGDRNSPTVYNAAGHFVQFWDGRAPTVEEQAKGPVMNPVEMAMHSDKAVVAVLNSMPEYVQAFKRAFPEDKNAVTFDNMAKAIGAFERRLVTPSRWDHFLKGNETALQAEEKAGFNTFVDAGCQICHVGTYVGGNLYQKLGLREAWPDSSDPGRYKVTKNEADRMVFKVPALRNVAMTGPYFHNGKVASLDEAVSQMARYQLGTTLSGAEVRAITTFLKSLTGNLPAELIQSPALPKSTALTPKPQTI